MNTPPFLMLAGLLFWGWWTELPTAAVVLGVVLECSRLVRLRWDFSAKELRRIWDVCVILVVGAVVYVLFSDQISNPYYAVLQWLPILFAPIMLAQAYGHAEKIPATVFSIIARATQRADTAQHAVNVSPAYFGVCLLSASATNASGPLHFPLLCGLVAWACWPARSRRVPRAAWIALWIITAGAAHVGAGGLHALQDVAERRFAVWVAGWLQQDFDENESRTSIGAIGELKQSGRIVLRVESDGPAPELLRAASYDHFKNTTWFSSRKEFADLGTVTEEGYWKLIPNRTPRQTVAVASFIRKGRGVVALPQGTAEIDRLPALRLQTNWLGVVRTVDAPGLVRYVARYGPDLSIDGAPGEMDLEVPENERAGLSEVVRELDLPPQSVEEAARRLSAYFEKGFQYSTTLRPGAARPRQQPAPITHFLKETRTGHCEYFATATVLLLRQAGIPARYATGFSVQESAGAGRYVVRERHAHAWALYYDAAAANWRELDTTPAGWGPIEAAQAAPWEVIRDFFSRVWFEIARWRWLADRSALQSYLLWLVLPLSAILAYRLLTAKRRARGTGTEHTDTLGSDRPGLDSEFYEIERRLATRGLGRLPEETLTAWWERVRTNPLCPPMVTPLEPLLNLHHRYRFDPAGLPWDPLESTCRHASLSIL